MMSNRRSVLFILIFLVPATMAAQKLPATKPKLYESWVNSGVSLQPPNGLLYEIRDSSVVIANTRNRLDLVSGRFIKTEIPYSDIRSLKIRRVDAVKRSALIGGGIACVTLLGIWISLKPEFGDYGIIMWPTIGLMSFGFGALTGGLIGLIKDIIPVNSSYPTFDSNRWRLQKYSYLIENNSYVNPNSVRHKCYIGMMVGPAFPGGAMIKNSPTDSITGSAKNGNDFQLSLGYRLSEKWGFFVGYFEDQFEVKTPGSKDWWSFGGFATGPMYTISLGKMINLDLKPGAAYLSSQYAFTNGDYIPADGFGILMSSTLQFSFAKRWSILAGTNYAYSKQKFFDGRDRNMSSWNISFGVAYRFF